MTGAKLSATDPYARRRIQVLDTAMSYVDAGHGDPIVFLHGNPTWSYLWRNIIPFATDAGRCLAPDLVGMGQSGKMPSRSYRFADHARYLDAWFDTLELNNVILVLHDWGSALGFHWAHRHPESVQAIAYMEAIVLPRRWEDWPDNRAEMFRTLRSERGEKMVLEDNFMVETAVPRSVLRELTDEEMKAYRAPFPDRDSRRPILAWVRELPIEGEPANVVEIVRQYGNWLARSRLPKLFIAAEPGSQIVGRVRDFCHGWPNQRETTVRGIHFIQEDAPREIGLALRSFITELRE